jgi:hypothetical protein
VDVYLEVGSKRVFAAAVDWPGWCRAGKDEESALQALVDHAPRYAKVVGRSADFRPPTMVSELKVSERLKGDATTDFGAPGAIPKADRRPLAGAELGRLERLFDSCWAAFKRVSKTAEGRELVKGPRGGGRGLSQIEEHVIGAEESYAAQIGLRGDFTAAVRARAAGELPDRGPRGGERWPARYGIRRAAWHVLDHAWEIEDRLAPG